MTGVKNRREHLAHGKPIRKRKWEIKMLAKGLNKRFWQVAALSALMAVMILPALAKTKPTVAIIRAEWCSACQKLEPTMMKLMQEYGDKVEFVMLDVSSDETSAQAQATAKKRGLGKFFEEHKQKTSTVAVFVNGNTPDFVTMQNFDREAYVKAFNEAIAKAGK